MCSSATLTHRSLVSADFLGKFLLLFLAPKSTIPGNKEILLGILDVYSKNKLIPLRKRKCSDKHNKKELQNYVCHLGTGSGEKVEFSGLGKHEWFHVINVTSDNWQLQLFFQTMIGLGTRKCYPLKKKRAPFITNISQSKLLVQLSLSKFMYAYFL